MEAGRRIDDGEQVRFTLANGEDIERSALEPGLLRAGIALAISLGVLEIASHLLNELVVDAPHRHLGADTEWNLWAWEGSAAFFAAALSTLLCAVAVPAWRGRLLVLGAWFAFLSADDVIEVHERLGIRLGSALGIDGGEEASRLWVVVYMPAMALSLLALLRVARILCSGPAGRVLHAGLVVLAVAVGAEVAVSLTTRVNGSNGWIYDVTVAVEEASESSGWLLVATALACAHLAAVVRAGILASEQSRGRRTA